MPGHAADIHDAAGLLRQHCRRRVLDSEKDAFDVDREDLIDGRHIDRGDADHWRGNSGVVHQAIETTEPFKRSIDHRLDVSLVGYVRANETNANAFLERAALFLASPDDHDLGPFRDESFGDAFADAARAARYDSNLAIAATYINQLGNDVPGGLLTVPTLALGDIYRSPNFSPFETTLSASYRSRFGLRINPVERINIGYPIGVGAVTARELNGTFLNLPNTNLAFGPGNAYYFVDPQNPGTYQNPNVAATRSTVEGSSAGSILSQPRFETDLTVELKSPRAFTTYGIAVSNLFNQLYGIPVANPFYANVVSTGVTGPGNQYAPFVPAAYTRSPYLIFPNGKPLNVRFYVQVAL